MDNRAERLKAEIRDSKLSKHGRAYFERNGTHDQPRTDKYKNKHRKGGH